MDNITQLIATQIDRLEKEKADYNQKFKTAVKSGNETEADYFEREMGNLDRAIFELQKTKTSVANFLIKNEG